MSELYNLSKLQTVEEELINLVSETDIKEMEYP